MLKRLLRNPIKKGFAGVSLATLISRILGYARDVLMAKYFGTSMFADAFYVAFRIPNLLRRLLGEGALPAALIPSYSEMLSRGETERAKKLVGNIFTFLFAICSGLVILGMLFTPVLVKIIAPGFADKPEQFALTITLARIMLPILLLITLATISMGISNARKYFFIPALAPALFNISLVSFFIFFAKGEAQTDIRGVALFALIGFLLHFAAMLPILLRQKVTKAIYFVKGVFSNPDVKKIFMLLIPAAVGLSVMQLNIFVDTICATLMGGGIVSSLYFATRIYQLPLSLFGVSISMVSLPFMANSHAASKSDEVSQNLFSSLSSSLFLLLPSTAGLMIAGHEIITLLFERGLFQKNSTSLTSSALVYYAAGLIAFAGVRIFANYFYAKKDMYTPIKIAVISFFINIVLDIAALILKLGPAGLAGATSIAAVVNFILLIRLVKKDGVETPKYFFKNLTTSLISTTIMVSFLLAPVNLHILLKICAAGAIYFASAYIINKIGRR